MRVTAPKWPHMLLRMGRFCQFESLSVDELRRGYRLQAKQREDRTIADMSSTRNLCDMGQGKSGMPFGWLLLTYVSGEP